MDIAPTPETKPKMNVYQKLSQARLKFLDSGATKSGKNIHLAFKYFELDDIVPIATKIFADLGLITHVSFDEVTACMTVINSENPAESLVFRLPLKELTGNSAINPVQAMGAVVTYYRRYLYMIVLDICEPDNIEPMLDNAPPAQPSVEKKSEIQLTDPASQASEKQIANLKKLLKQLLDTDKRKESFVAQLASETKKFTVISKADCESLIIKVNGMLKAGAENEVAHE